MAKLKEEIREGLNKALKEGDSVARSALSFLLSALLQKEKEKRFRLLKGKNSSNEKISREANLSDEEITKIILSLIKKNKEAALKFRKGERGDLVRKEEEEIEILKRYLPEEFSQEEVSEDSLKKLIKETIEENGFQGLKDMGRTMSSVMPKLNGRSDGALVSKLVKELLAKEDSSNKG